MSHIDLRFLQAVDTPVTQKMPYAVSPWPNWRRPWPWRDVTSFTCREPRFSSRHWINAHVHLFLFSICYNAVPRPARSHPKINLSQSHCDLHNFSHTIDRSILTEFINQSGPVYAGLSQDHLDWSIWLGWLSKVWVILSRSQWNWIILCVALPLHVHT